MIEDQILENKVPELSIFINSLVEFRTILKALVHFVVVGVFLYNTSRFLHFSLKILNVRRLVPSYRQQFSLRRGSGIVTFTFIQ